MLYQLSYVREACILAVYVTSALPLMPDSKRRRSVTSRTLALGAVVLALTIDDRERLLWALDDARTDAWPSGEIRKDSSDGGRTPGRSCRSPTKSFNRCSIRSGTCIDSRMRSRVRKRGSTRTFALV